MTCILVNKIFFRKNARKNHQMQLAEILHEKTKSILFVSLITIVTKDCGVWRSFLLVNSKKKLRVAILLPRKLGIFALLAACMVP